ncbi:MAG TPA: hypothetical protein VEK80_01855 [Kribbellaceae bacterium]|nr:hypothetical protein [Kribbellaceae bacterium]
MRQPFVHEAVVELEPGGDPRAPGGAVTVALCGRLEHEPPCPLAPHHTAADADGDTLRLRVLFAAEPSAEHEVRALIESALGSGSFAGPDGTSTRWQLRQAGPGAVTPPELDHADRLVHT